MTRLLYAAALLLITSLPLAAQTPQITVTGTGEVAVPPDLARLSIGVSHTDRLAKDAMAQMSVALEALLARLADSGIAAEDIQTSGLSLSPVTDYSGSSPRVTGYTAQSDVAVTVRALDGLGGVLDQVVADGANQISGLQFDVADRAPHLAQARSSAVEDAAETARTLASAASVALGPILLIAEQGAAQPPQPMMEARMMADSGPVPIAQGQIVISAGVTITYAISQ